MMSKVMNRLITWHLAVVILLVLMVPEATAAFRYLREGMEAPSVAGIDLISGEPVSSDKMLQDNMVIVVFWASWSQRSVDELVDLKAIHDKYSELPLKIIAVNVESQSISAPVRLRITELATEMDLPFPVIVDEGLKIFYSFGVIAVPSTAVLDTNGILRYGPAGYSLTTHDLIVDSIEVLTGLRPPGIDTVVQEGYRPTNKSSRYYNLALNQANRRQYERALGNLVSAESADSAFAGPHLLRGEVYLKLDSLNAAVTAFGRAVELDSASVVAWAGLGRALLKVKSLDSALSTLVHAVEMDETYTPAQLDLGLCLSELGQIEPALDSLKKARDLNLMDPMIHYYMGQVYLQAGDTAQAAQSFKTALEIFYPAK